MDSPTLPQARKLAAIEGTAAGSPYCEGYELDGLSAKLIPAGATGRMLDAGEVRKLVRQLEHEIPKRATAASVKRRGYGRTRARR